MVTLAGLVLALAHAQTASTIELKTPAFAAHYCTLRYFASGKEEVPKDLSDGVALLKEIDESLPDTITLRSGERKAKSPDDRRVKDLYWSLIDSQVIAAASLDEFRQRVGMLPAKIGGALDTKVTFEKIQKALEATVVPAKLREVKDSSILFQRLGDWQKGAVPHLSEVFGFLADNLQIKTLPPKVRVVVVPLLAGKGGITLRGMDGTVVVIGCNRFEGANFNEVVIHETIHAFDAIEGNLGLFVKVRKDLTDGKVDSAVIEQIIHTMIFMHAAEAVRQGIDSNHKDVGETFDIYKGGLQKYVDMLRPILSKYWSKQMTLEQTSQQIVARMLLS